MVKTRVLHLELDFVKLIEEDACIPVFIAALFIVARIRKQPQVSISR